MMEPADLRRLIQVAPPQLKAMVLLGLNAGYGCDDVARLPISALDLKGGWCTFNRPKTEIFRRCRLWAETVEALKQVIAERLEPATDAVKDLVFLAPCRFTKKGIAWLVNDRANPVTLRFAALLKKAGLHRPQRGFYDLRHIFLSIADGSKDVTAVSLVMGHAERGVSSNYRERSRFDDSRLTAVSDYVHHWLFNSEKE
jgi:integrase